MEPATQLRPKSLPLKLIPLPSKQLSPSQLAIGLHVLAKCHNMSLPVLIRLLDRVSGDIKELKRVLDGQRKYYWTPDQDQLLKTNEKLLVKWKGQDRVNLRKKYLQWKKSQTQSKVIQIQAQQKKTETKQKKAQIQEKKKQKQIRRSMRSSKSIFKYVIKQHTSLEKNQQNKHQSQEKPEEKKQNQKKKEKEKKQEQSKEIINIQ